jgi:undecaprenyl diphosphate synthase
MDQQTTIPAHLGIILDGNRRWARAQGLPTLEGHRVGYLNLKKITKSAIEKGVEYVSAYIFSSENWSRSKEEVKYLMSLVLNILTIEVAELNRANIRVVWLGSKEKLSKGVIKAITKAEEKTKNNTAGTLCLCFNYGGHQEIVDAVKTITEKKTPSEEITHELILSSLYQPTVPPLDLIIRTSGERRISGFMLYRAAYSELYFTSKHWPDFDENDLDDALEDYANRQRRFGK